MTIDVVEFGARTFLYLRGAWAVPVDRIVRIEFQPDPSHPRRTQTAIITMVGAGEPAIRLEGKAAKRLETLVKQGWVTHARKT